MKRKLLFACLISLFCIIIPKNVNALEAQPRYFTYYFYEYDWTWNYRQAAYYYIVDTSSIWNSAISQAAQNWFHTGYHTNPLYPMTRTYIRTDSPMDFYKDNNLSDGTNGVTNFFIKGGTQVQGPTGAPSRNWLYCKIYIHEDYFQEYYGDNPTKRKLLIIHEMGHVFGLAHQPDNPASVMHNWLNTTTATAVSEIDSIGLVTKLGGV